VTASEQTAIFDCWPGEIEIGIAIEIETAKKTDPDGKTSWSHRTFFSRRRPKNPKNRG
jgi:hypothetical protein